MNSRSLIINIVLLAAISAMAAMIYMQPAEPEKLPAPTSTGASPVRETEFDPESVRNTYTNFGEAALFRAIMTPTPTPTPTPPPPEKTPDIHNSLKGWRLMSAGDGEATIEDRALKEDDENRIFFLRVGAERTVNTEVGQKKAKLVKIDEASDTPSAEFSMEGTEETKQLKMEF